MQIELIRNRLPRFSAELEAGISASLHFGGQAFISLKDEIVADFGFGISQPDVPVTSDMLMPWMSGSKPIAAAAIGQLFERRLIGFDDPVVRFIPRFGQAGKSPITIRQLLTHTCGFRGKGRETPETSWDDIIESVCALPLESGWIPGEKAGYHIASSWFILGEIIHRIDGRDYAQYVRQEIFEPLEMNDSWIGMPREQFLKYGPRIGWMYSTERGMEPRPHPWHTEAFCTWCAPGGGGRGPMHDLGRFYLALLAGGAGPRNRILQPETVALLTRRQRIGMFDETFQHKIDWGLGFIINSAQYGMQTVPYSFGNQASLETFGHGGFQSSCGLADPQHQLVITICLNGTPGEARHNKRIRILNSAIYNDLGLANSDMTEAP